MENLTLFQLLVKFDSTVVPAKIERNVSSKNDNRGFVDTITKQPCRHIIYRNFNFSLVFKTRLLEKRQDCLRWPNTVFARAFADAIQRGHKDCKKETCRQ